MSSVGNHQLRDPTRREGSRREGSVIAALSVHRGWLGDLAGDVLVRGWVLHEGQDPGRHESCGADGRSAAGDLGDRDDPAPGLDLDTTPVPGGDDLIGADFVARIDDDLHSVTTHTVNVLRRADSPGSVAVPSSGLSVRLARLASAVA